jgi:hypothetical protein
VATAQARDMSKAAPNAVHDYAEVTNYTGVVHIQSDVYSTIG